MRKYEVLFKKTLRSRKLIRWERFYDGNGLKPEMIKNVIEKANEEFGNDPVILSIRELPYHD